MSGQKDDRSTFSRYLAPNYPYHANISTPDDMKMKTDGGLDTLATDFVGLINYGELLVMGTGNANKKMKYEGKNEPLGDRVFIDTPGKCHPVNMDGKFIDPETNAVLEDQEKPKIKVDRAVFIDHIPTGYIPGLGNMSTFRGLVPGMLGNLLELNPVSLLKAFTAEATPPCLRTKMETVIYKKNNSRRSKHKRQYKEFWVAKEDLASLNPCSFKNSKIDGKNFNNKNPITNKRGNCKDGFDNIFNEKNMGGLKVNLKGKPLANIFNASFGLLLAYILFKVLKKEI